MDNVVARFEVHHEAHGVFQVYVFVEDAGCAKVVIAPDMRAVSEESGIPLNEIYEKAMSFAKELVAKKTGVDLGSLYVSRLESWFVLIRTREGTSFPRLGLL